MKTASDFAVEAARLVGNDRADAHGFSFSKIAVMWNAYMSVRRDPTAPLDAADCAYMMAQAKMVRTHSGNRHNLDNPIDAAGYSACAAQALAMEMEAANKNPVDVSELASDIARKRAEHDEKILNEAERIKLSREGAGKGIFAEDTGKVSAEVRQRIKATQPENITAATISGDAIATLAEPDDEVDQQQIPAGYHFCPERNQFVVIDLATAGDVSNWVDPLSKFHADWWRYRTQFDLYHTRSPATAEHVPDWVYQKNGTFYNENGQWMGLKFSNKWISRIDEFPPLPDDREIDSQPDPIPEPIPPGIYTDGIHFFDHAGDRFSYEFRDKWKSRIDEFPQQPGLVPLTDA